MVSTTAELTAKEIADALGTFENLAKVLVQRMFNMNFFRPSPSKYGFYFQDAKIVGKRQNINAKDDTIWIGLRPGETDGTKAAILAYIVKAAPTHIDTKGFKPKPPTPAPVTMP